MSSRGYFIGLLTGLLVGTGLGLLIAPNPGAESRRKVSRAARSAGGRVADVASSVGQSAKRAVSGIRPSM